MPESQVTCSKTAWVQVVRNNWSRVGLRILNIDSTNPVRLARDGGTPPGATLLATDEVESRDPRRSVWAYAPTAAVIVSVNEEYTELGKITRGRGVGVPAAAPPPPPPSGNGGGDGGYHPV